MKTLFYNAILIVIMYSISDSNLYAQNRKLTLVKIEWEDFSTETVYDVNCDSFRSLFATTIENKSFNDSLYLSKFNQLIKCFKMEREYKTIDVRGIITFYYQKTKVEYCFDKFGHFYKDGILTNNKKLMSFITKNFYSKHFTP
jgi:hypothetical protein